MRVCTSLLTCICLVGGLSDSIAGRSQILSDCHRQQKAGTDSFIGCVLCATKSRHQNSAAKPSDELGLTHHSANQKVFSNIYDKNVWGEFGGGSGLGSDPNQARSTALYLKGLLYRYGLVSMIDAPCGAVHASWMRQVIEEVTSAVKCFEYYGLDVVLSVVSKNVDYFANYSNQKSVRFSQVDLSLDHAVLPTGYKLILSRDALQHLSFADIAGVLRNFCKTDAEYLLVGSYLDSTANVNIPSGSYFSNNMLIEPFHFPPPLESFREDLFRDGQLTSDAKYLTLYELRSLCTSNDFIMTYGFPN
jgi:hypothetical protein